MMRDALFKYSIQKQQYVIAMIYGCCSVDQTEVRRDCDTVCNPKSHKFSQQVMAVNHSIKKKEEGGCLFLEAEEHKD